MVTYKAPSYGLFKTNITPMYWFGIPRNVKISGLTMDVDRITHLLAHKDNNHEQWVNYNRASGARLSAMEHLVPEQMFSTDENPAHGISAVKAIQLAAAEGQKIWTITRTNLNLALNSLQLPTEVKNDIRNSVNAGKEVTAHERAVNFFGRSSVGYIVLDPESGAGAYLTGSGDNGGELIGFALVLGLFMFFASVAVLSFLAAPGFLAVLALAWIAINFYFWVRGIENAKNHSQFNTNNAMAALALSLGFIPRLTFEIAAMVTSVDAWIFMLGLI